MALPFYMSKRAELPSPKRGQKEWGLFKQIYGAEWNEYEALSFDPEEKITEFNYEKFISANVLKTMDTKSDDFKRYVKLLNFTTKTKYEQHLENQKSFQGLMGVIS